MEKNHDLAILLLILGFVGAFAYPREFETINEVENERVPIEKQYPNSDPYSATTFWAESLARVRREEMLTPGQRKALNEQNERELRERNMRRQVEQQREAARLEQERIVENRRAMLQNRRLTAEMEAHWNRQN